MLVEKKRLAMEYLDLRQTTYSVTEITKIFTKRTLFCPEFAASKQQTSLPVCFRLFFCQIILWYAYV